MYIKQKYCAKIYCSRAIKYKKNDVETIGVEICPNWRFAYTEDTSKVFVASIWDFKGQDRQYPLHQYFMNVDTLYVLLSDNRTDSTALDKLRSINIKFQYNFNKFFYKKRKI